MIFGFGKKKSAPAWKDLSSEQKRSVAGRIAKSIVALSGARYKVVSGDDVFQREQGVAEHNGEDWVLNAGRRNRMLNLARNQMRNSPTFVGIMKQFDLNAVGTQGGKATFAFDDMEKANALRAAFAKWTRDAEFYDGLSLNTLLKVLLRTYLIGGDAVLLFDDGLLEDSGRIVFYEPDMIGNVSEEALVRHYGKGAKQSLGRVVNAYGRFQGVIVSRSQRGQEIFDPRKCYFLSRDPQKPQLDSLWMMPRNVWRVEQGRGYPQIASSLATTIDLEDLCGYELASAKANSQTLAQVIQEAQQEEAVLPSAFDTDTDFSSMTEAELNAAVEAEKSTEEQTMTLSKMKSAGCIYESLPQGFRLELLDTKHPNASMPEFIRWLAGRSAAPFGLGQIYATLKADSSYTAFRGEQMLSWQSFYEAQKFLESICDWIVYRWGIWAEKKGIVSPEVFEEDWIRKVSWQWAKMKEVDEVNNQNAINLKLKNATGSYLELYGADWREKLMQVGQEIQWCKEHSIPHPALQTVNGSIIESDAKSVKDTEDTQE